MALFKDLKYSIKLGIFQAPKSGTFNKWVGGSPIAIHDGSFTNSGLASPNMSLDFDHDYARYDWFYQWELTAAGWDAGKRVIGIAFEQYGGPTEPFLPKEGLTILVFPCLVTLYKHPKEPVAPVDTTDLNVGDTVSPAVSNGYAIWHKTDTDENEVPYGVVLAIGKEGAETNYVTILFGVI